MHDSVPLLNTNIHQNYLTDDYNLGPISEDDESSLPQDIPDDSQMGSGNFERGGFKRSTVRNSKKKNFMQLKIDMTVCKNNHISPLKNQQKNDRIMGVPDKISLVKTPDSPLTPVNIKPVETMTTAEVGNNQFQERKLSKLPPSAAIRVLDLPTSTTSPHLTKILKPGSPNLSSTKSSPNLSSGNNVIESSSSNISLSSAKLEFHRDLSLSDGEEIFEDLSNEVEDELSAEEEEFDRISMCLDLENIESKFEETFNGQREAVENDGCKPVHADHHRTPESTEIQKKEEKPHSPETRTDKSAQDQRAEETVCQKSQLKQDIAYWEKRASNSAESRVLAKNINENFKRSSLQRSTLKRKTRPSFDRNLRQSSCSMELTREIVSRKDDLLEMTSEEKSANTVPYFDGKNDSSGCNRPQSITPPQPAPRKKVAGGRTKILDRGDSNDRAPSQSSHLPKLATDKRTSRRGPGLVFSIKTWDERRKEKNRSMPTKRLVEWF